MRPCDLDAFFEYTVRWDPDTEEPIDWLADPPRRKALGEAILASSLFREVLKVGRVGDKPFAPIAWKRVPALFGTRRETRIELEDREDDRTAYVHVALHPGSVRVDIRIDAATLAPHRATALD